MLVKNINKKELLDELKETFQKTKKDIGFNSDFEEINNIFYLEPYILREGFVSPRFSTQLRSKIIEVYNSWLNYLHSLIMPNQTSMISMMESKTLDDKERKNVGELIKRVMIIISKNSLINLKGNKKEEAEFIDYCVNFWVKEFNPSLILIMEKIDKEWRGK